MIRRLRTYPLEELLVAQAIPGFLLAVGWTVMYEVYHEEGAFYTSLIQEIVSTEDLFPYFVVAAILMAFPLGLVLDSVRHVVGEVWLRLPDRCGCGAPTRPPVLLAREAAGSAERYLLYRHIRAVTLTPAKAAGNLAVVFTIFTVWLPVKLYRMQAWHVFSWAFILGAPLVGLALVVILTARYRREMRAFLDLTEGPQLAVHTPPSAGAPPHTLEPGSAPEVPSMPDREPAPKYQ